MGFILQVNPALYIAEERYAQALKTRYMTKYFKIHLLFAVLIVLIGFSCNNKKTQTDDYMIVLLKSKTNFCNNGFDTIFPYHRICITYTFRVYNNTNKTLIFSTRDPSDLYGTYFDCEFSRYNINSSINSNVAYKINIPPKGFCEFDGGVFGVGYHSWPHNYMGYKNGLSRYLDNPNVIYNVHIKRGILTKKIKIEKSLFYFVKYDCSDKWKNGWD